MSERWNLDVLRQHLYTADCDNNDFLLKLVRSVDRSIQIFHFYAYSARDAMKGIVADGESTKNEHLLLLFGVAAQEQQEQYGIAKLAGEAHVLATMHSARFMFDQFSQLANQLLLTPAIDVEKCDLNKVCEALPKSDLKSKLTELTSSHWFLYLQGFVNTSKHRSLIDYTMTVSFEHNVSGIKIEAFEYRGRHFPQYWVTEVLTGAFEVKNTIVQCGRLLNSAIGL